MKSGVGCICMACRIGNSITSWALANSSVCVFALSWACSAIIVAVRCQVLTVVTRLPLMVGNAPVMTPMMVRASRSLSFGSGNCSNRARVNGASGSRRGALVGNIFPDRFPENLPGPLADEGQQSIRGRMEDVGGGKGVIGRANPGRHEVGYSKSAGLHVGPVGNIEIMAADSCQDDIGKRLNIDDAAGGGHAR